MPVSSHILKGLSRSAQWVHTSVRLHLLQADMVSPDSVGSFIKCRQAEQKWPCSKVPVFLMANECQLLWSQTHDPGCIPASPSRSQCGVTFKGSHSVAPLPNRKCPQDQLLSEDSLSALETCAQCDHFHP